MQQKGMEQKIKYLNHYSLTTGVRSILIDTRGQILYDRCGEKNGCEFCIKAEEILGIRLDCREVHLYGSYQAERFGGKYVFFCPLGLTHWASPIVYKNDVTGFLLGGPVMIMDPEEFLIDDIFIKYGIKREHIDDLKKYLKNVPVVGPEKLDSLSEMLFLTAAYLSENGASLYSTERETLEQQADISSYIHYIKTMGGDEESLKNYPLEKEKELLSKITLGDKEGSQKVLNEIFGFVFFSSGSDFKVVKARVLELVVLLSRAAMEGGADIEQIFGLNYRFLNDIHTFYKVEELTHWLMKIMNRFTECVFNFTNIKHADVIYKAVDYIKRNYMRKISLEEVASHVYLSPSYFSKIFKEEIGSNFITYLNKLRIKVSRELLLDDGVELVDVSNIVGYEDQSYFSRTFKKLTGVTPGKYRESRGKVLKQKS